MKFTKRALAVLLALVMALSLFAVSLNATAADPWGQFWALFNETLNETQFPAPFYRLFAYNLITYESAYHPGKNYNDLMQAYDSLRSTHDSAASEFNTTLYSMSNDDLVAALADGTARALIEQYLAAFAAFGCEANALLQEFLLSEAIAAFAARLRQLDLINFMYKIDDDDTWFAVALAFIEADTAILAGVNLNSLFYAGAFEEALALLTALNEAYEDIFRKNGIAFPYNLFVDGDCPCADCNPGNGNDNGNDNGNNGGTCSRRTIFSTRWRATWYNWLLFFLGFGFIWMWIF